MTVDSSCFAGRLSGAVGLVRHDGGVVGWLGEPVTRPPGATRVPGADNGSEPGEDGGPFRSAFRGDGDRGPAATFHHRDVRVRAAIQEGVVPRDQRKVQRVAAACGDQGRQRGQQPVPAGDLGPQAAAAQLVVQAGQGNQAARGAVGRLGQVAVDTSAAGLGQIRVEKGSGVRDHGGAQPAGLGVQEQARRACAREGWCWSQRARCMAGRGGAGCAGAGRLGFPPWCGLQAGTSPLARPLPAGSGTRAANPMLRLPLCPVLPRAAPRTRTPAMTLAPTSTRRWP